MITLHRTRGKQAYIYGPVSLFLGKKLPHYAKVVGVWPALELHLGDQPDGVTRKFSVKDNGKQWRVSLSAVEHGLPPEVLPVHNIGTWTRQSELVFVFQAAEDLTPTDRREAIAYAATECLLQFKSLCDEHLALFGCSLTDVLGISVIWSDDEAPDEEQSESVNGAGLHVEPIKFNGWRPPNLRFAQLRRALLNGETVATGWNSLVSAVVRFMPEEDRRVDRYGLGIRPGNPRLSGFRYLSDVGYSVQGRASGSAWRRLLVAVKGLSLTIEVEFEWPPNRGDYPGQRGIMSVGPGGFAHHN